MLIVVIGLGIALSIIFSFILYANIRTEKKEETKRLLRYVIRNIDPNFPYTLNAVGERAIIWEPGYQEFIASKGYGDPNIYRTLMDYYTPYRMYSEDEDQEYLVLSFAPLDQSQSFINRALAPYGTIELSALMVFAEESIGGPTVIVHPWDFGSGQFAGADKLQNLLGGDFPSDLANTARMLAPVVQALRHTRLISDRISTEKESSRIVLKQLTETAAERNLYRVLLSRPELEGPPAEVIFRGPRGAGFWYLGFTSLASIFGVLIAGPIGILSALPAFIVILLIDKIFRLFPATRELY